MLCSDDIVQSTGHDMTSGQRLVDALSTYIYRPLERFLYISSHFAFYSNNQPTKSTTNNVYLQALRGECGSAIPRRHHTTFHHHSPRFSSFPTQSTPFFFEVAPLRAENVADNSTTALSRTELPTSGCPASTASADRKLPSFTIFFDRSFLVRRANYSDGPDPHVEGAKGGKASGTTGESYKPSENDGLKKDGTEDKRLSSEHGFGGS